MSGSKSAAKINTAKINMHIIARFLLNGMQTRTSEPKQTPAVRKVHNVEEKSSETLKPPHIVTVRTTPTAAIMPNGAARFSAFFAKLPRTMLKLGSNVSKNDGAPIISALMRVSCMGLNG